VSSGRFLLYFLTASSFLLAGLAVLVGPPPLWVPVAFGALYLGVIVVGVMNLRLQMFGDAVCQVPDAPGKVALTFDDGPDPVGTRQVLSILAEANVKATFFVVGEKVARHPEVVREIAAAGHTLGVHSYDHPRMYSLLPPRAVKADIERTRDQIEAATGVRPIWFRPPVGQMSPRTARGVDLAEAVVVGWNVRALDGLRRTEPKKAEERVTKALADGAIVLLHDAWERDEIVPSEEGAELGACPAGVRALPEILRACRARQLAPVTLEELIASSKELSEMAKAST
jgi:peptidoglycan/xylan/chitin deacetylase (PgdA/CDA1 family)